MKVEQLFACHHISEERKLLLATLIFQRYALYWWTSLDRERRIYGNPPLEYWNDLNIALRKRHIPSYYERELMDKLQRLRQGSISVEEYRQQMELLLLRVGLREEERTIIVTFTILNLYSPTNRAHLIHHTYHIHCTQSTPPLQTTTINLRQPGHTQPLMRKIPQPESLFSVYETNPIFVTLSLCGGWGVRIAPLWLRLRRFLLQLSPLEQTW